MDPQMLGGNQFSLESLMTPNFVFFAVTLTVIGYLYQTRMILGREQQIKSQSSNLFDKQMYLEIGFMILIGFCIYIFNNNDNNTFIWVYMLFPIIYLMMKSLLIFNKVADFIKDAPEHVDVNNDLMDLINAQKNKQIPVTNQNSNTTQITSALSQSLGVNMNPPLGGRNNANVMPQQPTQPVQQVQQFGSNGPQGFSLF